MLGINGVWLPGARRTRKVIRYRADIVKVENDALLEALSPMISRKKRPNG